MFTKLNMHNIRENIKEIFAIIITVIVFAFAVYQGITKNMFFFFAIITTLIIILSILYFSVQENKEVYLGLCSLCFILTAIGLLKDSNLLDPSYGKLNYKIMLETAKIGHCPSEIQLEKIKQIKFNMLKETLMYKCGTQTYTDVITLALNAYKAKNLDPVTGLIDSMYQELKKEEQLTCVETAIKLDELCPKQFYLSIELKS